MQRFQRVLGAFAASIQRFWLVCSLDTALLARFGPRYEPKQFENRGKTANHQTDLEHAHSKFELTLGVQYSILL